MNWRFCPVCRLAKPPEAHHCRTCQQCIMMMDHHCPYVANCVGEGNRANFVLFLFWAALGTTITWGMGVYILFTQWKVRRRVRM